jgi:hypothetical protein
MSEVQLYLDDETYFWHSSRFVALDYCKYIAVGLLGDRRVVMTLPTG